MPGRDPRERRVNAILVAVFGILAVLAMIGVLAIVIFSFPASQ